MTSGATAAESVTRAAVIPLLPVWRVDRAFDYRVPEELGARLRVGSVVRMPFGRRTIRGVVVATSSEPAGDDLEAIAKLLYDVPLAPAPLHRLVDWVARRYAVARGVAFARVVPPRVRVKIPPVRSMPAEPAQPSTATLAGYENGAALLRAVRAGESGIWSLRALPGHDRGALVSELVGALGGRAGALVAVPEIRYGAPVLDRVQRDWPLLARVDSSMAETDRTRGLLALAAGHGLGGGGRASVLAPVPDLGLIVVDEEQDRGYKEDRSPRYDARRVAVERARLQGAIAVLVSATPSLHTGLMVGEGKWREARPTRRDRRAARPLVEVVEPVAERAVTRELHDRVRATLRKGERVALLVPRRGYARALWCASCKRSLHCPVCEAGLFYDRDATDGPRVRCARCGFTRAAPDTCPTCGAAEWRYLGAGSERLSEQVAKAFPHSVVRRMDPAVLASDRPRPEGPVDIYVTTWIGTKAAIRPPADLVGVVDADALIRRPDYRAAESAYHAFAELAEWAGPAVAGGRLVIQCSEPGHHAVQAVVRADHDYFVARELELRRELGYPPWAELVKVTASGDAAATTIAEAAAKARAAGGRVLGPIAVRSGGEEVQEVLVKAADAGVVAEALRDVLARVAPGALRVDVDPR